MLPNSKHITSRRGYFPGIIISKKYPDCHRIMLHPVIVQLQPDSQVLIYPM